MKAVLTAGYASKADLLASFFHHLPANDATEFPDAHIAICATVVEEFRKRAKEKYDVALLRDSHTLEHELTTAATRVRSNENYRVERTGLVLPGQM